jgi:hypothetical protein
MAKKEPSVRAIDERAIDDDDPSPSGDPFRTPALVVPFEMREAAFCPWCIHHWVDTRGNQMCGADQISNWTPQGFRWTEARYCAYVNKDGQCLEYSPTRFTRLVRLIGRRPPHMIEKKPAQLVEDRRRGGGKSD